jgi:hypothetical protein
VSRPATRLPDFSRGLHGRIVIALRDEDADQAGDEVRRHCEVDDNFGEPHARATPGIRPNHLEVYCVLRCFDPLQASGELNGPCGKAQQHSAHKPSCRAQSCRWARYFKCRNQLRDSQHCDHLSFRIAYPQISRRTVFQGPSSKATISLRLRLMGDVMTPPVRGTMQRVKLKKWVDLKSKKPGCIAATRAAYGAVTR